MKKIAMLVTMLACVACTYYLVNRYTVRKLSKCELTCGGDATCFCDGDIAYRVIVDYAVTHTPNTK